MKDYARLILLIFVALSAPVHAQVTRVGGSRLKPRATTGDALTLSASPTTVTFNLVAKGIALGSSPITVLTKYTGPSTPFLLTITAAFSSSAAALTGGSPVINIPTSCVFGKDPSGSPTAYTAFTQTSGIGGAGAALVLYQNLPPAVGVNRTDVLSLEINLTGISNTAATTYSGTLMLEAQAF